VLKGTKMTQALPIKTNVIVNRCAFSGTEFKEAIDFALVSAAFDQQVTLVFSQQGIYNLLKKQNADSIQDKTQTDILSGLEFYDIENLYIDQTCLDQSGLTADDLIDSVSILNTEQINLCNRQAHHLVNF